MKLRAGLRLSFVAFLTAPFIFLFFQFSISDLPEMAELWWAFKNSSIQAFFSALISLVLGFWVALSLVSLPRCLRTYRRSIEIICLLPNFLPALFILLALLNFIEPFPMGIIGIVIVHGTINFGLTAVLLSRVIESNAGSISELAYVEGASQFQFITRGLWPLIRKDVVLIGLFIFVICFSSFAIPLIVGGGRGTTIEVLIYEKIRLSHEWGHAVVLAFIQSAFIFALSVFLGKSSAAPEFRKRPMDILKNRSGLFVLAAISSIYIGGYLQGIFKGLEYLSFFEGNAEVLLKAFMGTLVLGMSAGILCFTGLMLIAFCWPKNWFERFLNGYVAPSTALTCFCLLILTPNEGFYSYLKVPVALTLLSLNGLFRLGWQGILNSLQNQMTVAYSMGATPGQIYVEILVPQISLRAGTLAGIASIWACGDFAVSRILAHKDISIAMMTETLMAGYRLNQAMLLSSLIVVAAVICFLLCVGGGRVLGQKFKA